jgi:hypothetical protein
MTECRQDLGFFFQTEAVSFLLAFFCAGGMLYRDPFSEFVYMLFVTGGQKNDE